MIGRPSPASPFAGSTVALVVLDEEGRIQGLNRSAEEVFGETEAEAVGRPATDLYELSFLDDTVPADVTASLAELGEWRGRAIQTPRRSSPRTVHAHMVRAPEPDQRALTYAMFSPDEGAASGRPVTAAYESGDGSRFQQLFEKLPEAFLIQDLAGHILDANDAAAALYGYERDELVGRDGRDITLGLDEETVAERIRLVQERGSVVFTNVGLRSDGRSFPQEVSLALDLVAGRPVAFLHVRDLSERQRLEAGLVGLSDLARLHGSEGTLADVSGRAMNFARRMLDADRAVICAFHGEGTVEWLAQHHMERFIAATVELRPTQIPWLERTLSTGRAELIDRRQPEHVRTPVSEIADQLGIAAYAIIPIRFGEELTGALGLIWSGDPPDLARDEELLGTIGRLIGLALGNIRLRDSLMARQRALDESEARYRTLFQDAPEPILIESWEGRIINANRAASELFGRERRDLIGRRAQEVAVIDREDRQRVIGVLQREKRGIFRGTGIRADGSTFPQEVVIVVMSFRGEESLLVQVRDMTERERMQAELLQAQKMEALGQLISGVAHELNNPLSAIVAFSQLMQRDERLPDDLHRDADLLRREAERTRRIVQNLLDFARQRRPERRPTSLRDLVDRTLELHAYMLGGGRVEAVVEMPDDLPAVDVDPSQLQQVLLNLTANAIQAIRSTGRGGRLVISAESVDADERVRLRFTDDGPGVPPDVEPRLFEPFFTTKPVGEGTGLGLSVSYGIVASHGGRLWYEPAPGGGASFIMEIPAVDGSADAAASRIITTTPLAREAEAKPGSETRQRRGVVLAIDDEPSIRMLLTRALGRVGHEVTVAASGAEAIAILERRSFDLMLVDHRMSGMDGLECYERAIRLRPELRERTVIMSGDTLNAALSEFAERHSLRMLAKPFDVAAVVQLVDDVLRQDAARA